jgi:hypothetical protein
MNCLTNTLTPNNISPFPPFALFVIASASCMCLISFPRTDTPSPGVLAHWTSKALLLHIAWYSLFFVTSSTEASAFLGIMYITFPCYLRFRFLELCLDLEVFSCMPWHAIVLITINWFALWTPWSSSFGYGYCSSSQ